MCNPMDICIACLLVIISLTLFGINDKLRDIREKLKNDCSKR